MSETDNPQSAAASPGPVSPRSRFGEFMVVMLGVLVALALEQVVLEWQERQRVDATIESLHEELVDFTVVYGIRLQVMPCIDIKLDAIDAALRDHAEFAVITNVGRPPYFFSSRGGWSGGSAELLSRHLGPQRARTYGEVYQGMEEYARFAQLEHEYWNTLLVLEGQSDVMDPIQRWRLREVAAGARNTALVQAAIAAQMIERIKDLGVESGAAELPVDVSTRPICLPLAG